MEVDLPKKLIPASDRTPCTLRDDDIKTERTFGRRSMLSMVAGVAGAGLATGVPVRGSVLAHGATGYSDNDSGKRADEAGNGRGTGLTDNDAGQFQDPVGNGTGQGQSGLNDSDSGNNADPAGQGRGNKPRNGGGLTDNDVGQFQDPIGGGTGPMQSGLNDSDDASSAGGADQGGYGRTGN